MSFYSSLSSLFSTVDHCDKKTEIFVNNSANNCILAILYLITTLHIR